MTTKIVLILSFIILIAGCESIHTSSHVVSTTKADLTESQKQRWNLMIGRWYGSQPAKGGGTRQHIMHRFSDGTYKVTVKHVKKNGEIELNSEVGQWGVVGPVYFSIFRGWIEAYGVEESDTSNPYNYDAYEIIRLTNEIITYKSYSSGTTYSLKKVASDFEFPEI